MKAMLAKNYDPKKVAFPVLVSAKLDGVRCLAYVTTDGVQLWSRDEKPIVMPHVQQAVEALGLPIDTVLDGELYEHGVPFQELSGHIRRGTVDDRKSGIRYHVYDVAAMSDGLHRQPYTRRFALLDGLIGVQDTGPLTVVAQRQARSAEEVQAIHDDLVTQGYEGAMVRTRGVIKATKKNPDGGEFDDYYQSESYGDARRSDFRVKVKLFEDAEAEIIGIEEELDLAGVPKGRTGKFVMRDAKGVEFRASGLTDEMKADSWVNREAYIGQTATYKFFGRSLDGVPRHPNFKALRPAGELDAAV